MKGCFSCPVDNGCCHEGPHDSNSLCKPLIPECNCISAEGCNTVCNDLGSGVPTRPMSWYADQLFPDACCVEKQRRPTSSTPLKSALKGRGGQDSAIKLKNLILDTSMEHDEHGMYYGGQTSQSSSSTGNK